MSKKAFFIFLPIIAILLCIYGNSGRVFHQVTDHGLSINRATTRGDLPISNSNLKKHSNTPNRNKIRIKAWDDYASLAIAPSPILLTKVFCCFKPVFFDRSVNIASTYSPGKFLRGPPVVV